AEAARLLEEVLRQGSLPADTAGRLAVKLASCAVDELRSKEVIGLLSDVLRRDLSRSVRGELRFRLALQLHEVGDAPERARRLSAEAVDELDDRPDLRRGRWSCWASRWSRACRCRSAATGCSGR